jgi:hypothetical protein
VIEELGDVFKDDETSTLMSGNAIKAAKETMSECSTVFAEIDATLKKSKKNTFGRLMLPFRDNKIELLRNHIDKLKSTLQLLMQVLTHAHQVATKKLDREAEAKQKAQIQELIELKKRSAKKYEESLLNFSVSDSSTIYDDDVSSLDQEKVDGNPIRGMNINAAAIGSTITPKTLDTCVQHVRLLLEDIERLQQTLATQVVGDDHSEHHQRLIGSYFRTRGHLDSVLLNGSHGQGVAKTPAHDEPSSTGPESSEVHISIQSPRSKMEVVKTPPDMTETTRLNEIITQDEELETVYEAETADQKAEREAEEAEDARIACNLKHNAKREAENQALFAGLKKNTMFGPGAEGPSNAFTPEPPANIKPKPAALLLETSKNFLKDQERWRKYDQERQATRINPSTVPRRPRADHVAVPIYEISPRRPRARSDTCHHFATLEVRPSPLPASHQEPALNEPLEGHVRPEHTRDSTESEIDIPKLKIPTVPVLEQAKQVDIDATEALMQENIRKVSERGEKLDSLQDKTDNLSVSAQGFRRGTKGTKRQPQSEYWSNPLGWFSSSSGSTDKVPPLPDAVDANETTVEVIAVESQNRFSALPASSPREEVGNMDEVDDLLKEWTTVF